MEDFLDILKYILPSLVVLLLAYLLIKAFLNQELKRRVMDAKRSSREILIPIQLQAYERLILFLERIQPAGLILRINQPCMNAGEMRSRLMNTIREEFDHNLSQQVYISSQGWDLVKNARESVIQVINSTAGQVDNQAPGHEFAAIVIENWAGKEHNAVSHAIEFLKEESRQKFQ